MFGYDWIMLAIMSGALIIGGVVKGVVGLGLPIITLGILLNFLPPLTVLGLLVAPILITNLWQALRAGNLLLPLSRFWPMIVMALIFLFIGAELIVAMDTAVLFGVLGVFVVLFSASQLIKPRVHPLKPETEKWAGPQHYLLINGLSDTARQTHPELMTGMIATKVNGQPTARMPSTEKVREMLVSCTRNLRCVFERIQR